MPARACRRRTVRPGSCDERPRDGFDQTARGECALGLAGPLLHRGEHRLAGARRDRNGVVGTRSTPRMRTISSTISALPSIRAARMAPRPSRGALPGDEEAEAFEHASQLGQRHSTPARRSTSDCGKSMTRSRLGAARHDDFRRLAAAQSSTMWVASSRPGTRRPDRRRARSDSAHPS